MSLRLMEKTTLDGITATNKPEKAKSTSEQMQNLRDDLIGRQRNSVDGLTRLHSYYFEAIFSYTI